jgi:benzoylformate decarboxylase
MNIREATFEWMRARGIHHIFGNPGSTELPFLVNLPDSVRYVLALQESIAVAMADGYAQASGQPALINLHVAPGLGNAMGVLFAALKNRAPLIVTCGQQDTRHIFHEPLLSGDLVGMARPVTKWAYEVKHAADVPDALEQAYHLAMTPPRGPVFVSIPMNFWDAPAEPPRLKTLHAPDAPQGLEAVAEALASAQKPALVYGAGVGGAGAVAEAVALAERLGCAVYHAPLNSRMGFPTSHPLYEGMLLPATPRLMQALSQHDFVLVVGAPVFLLYPYFPGGMLPPGVRAMLITDDPQEASRAPVERAFVGDIRRALASAGGAGASTRLQDAFARGGGGAPPLGGDPRTEQDGRVFRAAHARTPSARQRRRGGRGGLVEPVPARVRAPRAYPRLLHLRQRGTGLGNACLDRH